MQSYNSKLKNKILLKKAVDFHGHLGPYLVLGILAGKLAIKELRCKKYFGLDVRVWGANKKPKSCLVDGLQLSTGATYGKGNIRKFNAAAIKVLFRNVENSKKVSLTLKKDLVERLDSLRGHIDSELFAKELYRNKPLNIFKLRR